MIRPVFISFSVATALFLTACESDQQQKAHPKDHHQFGYTGEPATETESGAPSTDNGNTPPSSGAETSPDSGPIAPPPPPPPSTGTKPDSGAGTGSTTSGQKKDYPYATPVAGKPGFVTSPYAPYSGYVDVRGFPPGTEVKDPYTQKVFLVP
jgi:hypothetical protein